MLAILLMESANEAGPPVWRTSGRFSVNEWAVASAIASFAAVANLKDGDVVGSVLTLALAVGSGVQALRVRRGRALNQES
jgi:hypothetical protein